MRRGGLCRQVFAQPQPGFKGTDDNVTAGCPGWVDAEMLPAEYNGVKVKCPGVSDPADVAAKAINDAMKNRETSVCSLFAKRTAPCRKAYAAKACDEMPDVHQPRYFCDKEVSIVPATTYRFCIIDHHHVWRISLFTILLTNPSCKECGTVSLTAGSATTRYRRRDNSS